MARAPKKEPAAVEMNLGSDADIVFFREGQRPLGHFSPGGIGHQVFRYDAQLGTHDVEAHPVGELASNSRGSASEFPFDCEDSKHRGPFQESF